ncbi:MAG: D-alanine--D-alanine ligase [Candidatus Uhrbacteria bacterium]
MTSIAILTGGTSAERDIALTSSKTVARVLDGRYAATTFDFPSEIDAFLARRHEFAVAIPVFHGKGGEDGTVQGFLETLGIPYLFSGVAAHAVAMDKDLAKRVVASAGLRTAAWMTEGSPSDPHGDSHAADASWDEFPCVVKPLDGGSTQGVAIVRSRAELDAAVNVALRFSSRVLVESFVAGDEFTVAVADVDGVPTAMPVIQIKSPTGLYDYDAKYGQTPAEKLCPAPIADDLAHRLQSAALLAHNAIGARHFSRTDLIVDSAGDIWFLEINTIPGLSVLSPRAVAASGRDFGNLLASWIEKTVR